MPHQPIYREDTITDPGADGDPLYPETPDTPDLAPLEPELQ